MKILMVYYNYPQLSATYVEAEIQYLLRRGVDVEVWSETDPGSSYLPSCKVHRGQLMDAENEFQPDIVHYYWVKMAEKLLNETVCPLVTVRSHSFTIEVDVAKKLTAEDRVRSIFMFPDQAGRAINEEKIMTFPVAYDTWLFPEVDASKKEKRKVICTTAGLPAKALEDFIETARHCPELEFQLLVATCEGNEHIIPKIEEMNEKFGGHVEIRVDVPHADIPALLAKATFYMCTQKEVKRGMPIAIAEALASGCYVLVPDFPWLEDMIGPYGCTYSDPTSAASILKEAQEWAPIRIQTLCNEAPIFAKERFGAESVLPDMLSYWESILE